MRPNNRETDMSELINWYIGTANDGKWLVFRDPHSRYAFIYDTDSHDFIGLTEDRDFSRFSEDEGRLMDMSTYTSYEVV